MGHFLFNLSSQLPASISFLSNRVPVHLSFAGGIGIGGWEFGVPVMVEAFLSITKDITCM
jgi:hypothetical protein